MGKSREILISSLIVSGLLGLVDSFPIYFGIPIIIVVLYEWVFIKKRTQPIQVFLLIYLIVDFYLYGSTSIGNYILFASYILSLNIQPNFKVDIKPIIYIVLLLNLTVLIIYPGATQLLNFPDELVYKGFPGWIKYMLSNTVPLFIMSLFALRSGDNRLRLLILLTLILASKTTALVLFSIFWIIPLFRFRTFIRTLFFVLVSLFIVTYMISIPEYLQLRLAALVNLDLDSEYLIRFRLGLNSWETFLTAPIFGIGYYRVAFEGMVDVLKVPIGHHSHIFDSLGRFGILSLFFLSIEYNRWRSHNLVVIVLLWMILNNVVSFIWLLMPFIFNLNQYNENNRITYSSRS